VSDTQWKNTLGKSDHKLQYEAQIVAAHCELQAKDIKVGHMKKRNSPRYATQ